MFPSTTTRLARLEGAVFVVANYPAISDELDENPLLCYRIVVEAGFLLWLVARTHAGVPRTDARDP